MSVPPDVSPGSTEAEIDASLENYRKSITANNRMALTYYVEELERSSILDQPAQLGAGRVRSACEEYLGGLPEWYIQPRDLVDRYDEIVRSYCLDGVEDLDHSDEEAVMHDIFLSNLNSELSLNATHGFEGMLSVPEEFKILLRKVNALRGPGLAHYQERHQVNFLQNVMLASPESTREQVFSLDGSRDPLDYPVGSSLEWPDNIGISGMGEDWEIAGGWATGRGEHIVGFTVLCRAENRPWQWRYTIWNYSSLIPDPPLFDNLADFIDFYAHYEEPAYQDLAADIIGHRPH